MEPSELAAKVESIAELCEIPKVTLASLVGVHRSTYHRWTTGKITPRSDQVARLLSLSNTMIRAYNDKAFPLRRRGRKAIRAIAKDVREVMLRYN